MELTLAILKPSAVERCLIGEIISRIQKKGLIIAGMKMMHLNEKYFVSIMLISLTNPFFHQSWNQWQPLRWLWCVSKVLRRYACSVRWQAWPTDATAAPGTLRGDFCMSGQANIVHASDSAENGATEVARFFKPEEIFDWMPADKDFYYGADEIWMSLKCIFQTNVTLFL